MARRFTSHSPALPCDPVCGFCRKLITSRPDFGGSPGCKESTYYGPDGSDWCPHAGAKFPSFTEWRAAMDGKPIEAYRDAPYQYHAPERASVRVMS